MDNNLTIKWQECLNIINDNVDINEFETWFKPIEPISFEGNKFYIKVPSQFYYEYIDSQYSDLICSTIKRVFSTPAQLYYRVVVDQENEAKGTTQLAGSETNKNARKKHSTEFDSQLNPELTYNNFIEGDCNRLSRTVGINIASQPGKTIFNPLFIYGKSGVGKTHLVNAIGLKTKELHPQKKVLYVSANLFQQQYTEANKNGQVNDFLNFYQTVDVLIIDDIQEFGEGKKVSTQNQFFHIFNHLHQSGKQLILTCDKKPADLEGMEDRLLSRFKWGLSAEIESPSLETRKAILKMKSEKDGLELPEDVINYIAETVTDNIRNLEGSIISLIAYSTVYQQPIDINLARKVVSNIVHVEEKEQTVKSIRDLVCNTLNITAENLNSNSRKREVVQARQIAMYFAKKYTKDSLTNIGNVIGKRNHATVLHACKTVQDLIETDKSFRRTIEEIENQLNS